MANDLDYPHANMLRINAVRLYLQVETLAYIATETGDALQDSVKNKERQRVSSWSTKNWPKQEQPTEKSWETWSIFLHHIAPKKQLQKKLGDWINLKQ